MREIKFRAREVKAGNLIYTEEIGRTTFWDMWFQGELDLETIGQYTGLKDKNGKEIYEGDIIRFRESSFDDWTVGQVEYCGARDYPAFDVHPTVDCDSNGLSYIKACCEVEVIGNIYENPELLGS